MQYIGKEIPLLNLHGQAVEMAQCLSHTAMATLFQVYMVHPEKEYAQQAAWDAFAVVDRLEQEFSRFLPNSDISRLNTLSQGETIRVNLNTFACLETCLQLYEMTSGAFDATTGNLYELWLDENKSLKEPSIREIDAALQTTGTDAIQLDRKNLTVTLLRNNLQLDLGGVGKGYALDCMQEVLQEWEIRDALLHAGYSSVLAMGKPFRLRGWPLRIGDPLHPNTTIASPYLKNGSLSGSGILKGRHIIDPRTGQPVNKRIAAWAECDQAAICDGVSTALMVMSDAEVERFRLHHPQINFLLCDMQQQSPETTAGFAITNYGFELDSQSP